MQTISVPTEKGRLTMGGNNALLKKIDKAKQDCFVAGCDIATQQFFDYMCIVLNDPKVMGKDVFGAERLKKIHDAMTELDKQFGEAWVNSQESDYYQEKLDALLRQIFGEIDPFNKRYPLIKEWNYNKPSRRLKQK
jgi:hypothetical protein